MKTFMIISAMVLSLLWSWPGRADAPAVQNDNNQQTLDQVLQDIRQSQGIGSNDKIDCDKVTNKQYEQLGEAVMDVMHPDPREHAFMDRMMGGENSESLAAMHRVMGARYLGCYSGSILGDYGLGMMGGATVAGERVGPWKVVHNHVGWSMMNPWLGGWPMWLFLIVLVAILIYVVAQNRRVRGAVSSESPLDILRKRYARGEISKDEFERIKKDLQV